MNISWTEFQEIKSNLGQQGELKIRAISDSMAPLIKVNSILKVQQILPTELKPFDIITFWHNNTLICHFFWARQGRGNDTMIITKSLKDPHSIDYPINDQCLLGIVNRKTPLWAKLYLVVKNL